MFKLFCLPKAPTHLIHVHYFSSLWVIRPGSNPTFLISWDSGVSVQKLGQSWGNLTWLVTRINHIIWQMRQIRFMQQMWIDHILTSWSVVYGPASPSPVRDIRSQTRWISLQFNKSPGWISHTLWFEVFQIRAKPELGLAEDSDLLCTWVKQTWRWPTYAVVIWPWHTHLIFPSCLPRFPKIKAI